MNETITNSGNLSGTINSTSSLKAEISATENLMNGNLNTFTKEVDPTVPNFIKNISEKEINEWNENVKDLDIIFPRNTVNNFPIYIDDALEHQIFENKINGNSYQETTKGKQLYNFKDTKKDEAVNVDENGWITLSYDNTDGTGAVYKHYYTYNLNLELGKSYNIIAEIKSMSGVGSFTPCDDKWGQFETPFSYNSVNMTSNSIYNKICTTKTEYTGTSGLATCIGIGAGKNYSITFRLSVIEDTSITADTFVYEKYTGGIPSPSPDYPSEVEVVGGYNIYDATIEEITSNGVTWGADNEKLYINGISDNGKHVFKTQLFKRGTYTICFEKVSGAHEKNLILTMYKKGTWEKAFTEIGVSTNTQKSYKTFTLEEDMELELGIFSMTTNSYTNLEVKYQIVKGDVANFNFVPYGNLGFKITSKNKIKLLDKEETTKNGLTYSVKDNILTLNGTVTTSTIFDVTQVLYDLGNIPKSFTLNIIPISGTWSKGVMGISSRNGISSDSSQLQWHQSKSEKLSVAKEYTQEILNGIQSMWFYVNSDSTFENYKCYVQLTEGDTPDYDFAPYQEKITYLDLQGNFIGKVDDIKDELSLVGNKAKLNKNIKRYYFTGDEDIISNAYGTNSFQMPFFDAYFTENKITILSSHFIGIPFIDRTQEIANSIYKGDKWTLIIRNTTFTTLEEFKAFLKEKYDGGNPVYIDYILAEPYEVDLGTIDIETFEGVNNIFLLSSLDTNMEVTYALDLKKYIDKKCENIINALISTGANL